MEIDVGRLYRLVTKPKRNDGAIDTVLEQLSEDERSIARGIFLRLTEFGEEGMQAAFEEQGLEVAYKFGTMIEIPRAAVTADQIAEVAQFFSFGTNDLTQTTLGLSRDDAGSFLPLYVESGVYAKDPFQSLDTEGVGRLMRAAVKEGRAERSDLKVGICGEHGGDPDSIRFCHEIGLSYVSCSGPRVPVARLAAAHAALQ